MQKYKQGFDRANATRLVLIAKALNVRLEERFGSTDMASDVSSLIDVTDKSALRVLRAYSRIKNVKTQYRMVMLIEANRRSGRRLNLGAELTAFENMIERRCHSDACSRIHSEFEALPSYRR